MAPCDEAARRYRRDRNRGMDSVAGREQDLKSASWTFLTLTSTPAAPLNGNKLLGGPHSGALSGKLDPCPLSWVDRAAKQVDISTRGCRPGHQPTSSLPSHIKHVKFEPCTYLTTTTQTSDDLHLSSRPALRLASLQASNPPIDGNVDNYSSPFLGRRAQEPSASKAKAAQHPRSPRLSIIPDAVKFQGMPVRSSLHLWVLG